MNSRRTRNKQNQPARRAQQPQQGHQSRTAAAATDGRELVYAERTYVGPLPEPADLRAYDMVVPGSAATIVEAFADQTRHRRRLEAAVVQGSEGRSGRGQWMAFTALMAGVLGGSAVAAFADGTAGAAIVAAAFASSAITYALGGRPPKPEQQ